MQNLGNPALESPGKPLVSVIIPTHNRAALVAEAIESVLAQEGQGQEFNIEIIVVDDGSTDNTPEIVGRYKGVRYLRLDANRGVSAARNAGIMASKGAYLAFLDDDDVWLPQKLRLQVPVIEGHPEAGVVYGQIIMRFDGKESLEPEIDQALSGMVFREVLMGFFFPYVINLVIRREALEKAGMFDESFRDHEDYEFTARLAFHVPFVFAAAPVCIYRFNIEESKWICALRNFESFRPFFGIEKALALLPDSQEYAGIKLEARARGHLGLADDLAMVGEFDRMREYMRAGLHMLPRLLEDQWAAELIARMAGRLSGVSQNPIAAVRAFCADVRDAVGNAAVRRRLRLFQMLGEIWKAVAVQLSAAAHYRQAGSAAIRAMLYNPGNANSGLLGLMARGFLGPRTYAVLAFVKHRVR